MFVASALLACGDSVGPVPTAAELTVRIDSAAVHVQTTLNGYQVNVPFTVVNKSGRPLFYNAYCFTGWERQNGADWIAVGVMQCVDTLKPLRRISPYTSQYFIVGKSVGGPDVAVPDFAQPGAYRLGVLLYLDSRGMRNLPEGLATSNSFEVKN
jgi:hypothetical protein